MRRWLGNTLGRIVPFFVPKDRLIASLQLQRFLQLSEREASMVIKKIFQHVATNLFISINTKELINSVEVVWESESGVTKEEILSITTPILALTGHVGNWDLLGAYCASLGLPVSTIGRKARSPILQPILSTLRSRNGITTIWREDPKSPKQIIQALKNRIVLAALIDQDTTVRSDFIPFFSLPVKTPSGLFELSKKCGAFIVSAFLIELSDRRYLLSIERIPKTLTEVEALTLYHQHLEKVIRKSPHQWAWFHKRWRSSPDGITLGTKAYIKKLTVELEKRTMQNAISLFLSCSLIFSSLSGCLFSSQEPILAKAEQLRSEQNFEQAISLYQEHIEKRLRFHDREDWENPYFYELIIGDIYLEQGKLSEAHKAYISAKSHNVDHELFLDRIRQLASKYEERKDFQVALELLKPYANEDPILINSQLDRISKALVDKK
jgi:KDO2-lipid IV(A) lauroyltransferase